MVAGEAGAYRTRPAGPRGWWRAGTCMLPLFAGCAPMATVSAPPAPPAPPSAPAKVEVGMSIQQLTRFMADAAAWPAAAAAREIKRLKGGELAAADRFRLAWLLARKGAAPEELMQALALLQGLEEAFADPGSAQLARLVQRLVRLELEARAERLRAAELQDKIDRLKALERDLRQRDKNEVGK